MTTDRELAIFEAAIKLGALYHQWVGAPVSRASAESLEKAIEKSVILQPYVEEISVSLDRVLMTPNEFGYSEVRGLMFRVEIVTRVGFSYCRARLSPKDDYPYMEIVECSDAGKNTHY
ncbi:MAG: dihydroneopterin aldolase family protein [Methanomicrobiales archaeon]